MDKIYTIYKLIGKDRQFAIPIAETRSKVTAQKICSRMQKTVLRNERVSYVINPIFCLDCLKENNKVVAVNGSLYCDFHLAEQEKRQKSDLKIE